jgi:hypothetical protein
MKLLNTKEIKESMAHIQRRIEELNSELSGLQDLSSILEEQSRIQTIPPRYNPFNMEDEVTISKYTGLPEGIYEACEPFDQSFLKEITETDYKFDELTGRIILKAS